MTTSTSQGQFPKSVSIVAHGPSKSEYFEDCLKKYSRRQNSSETWGINAAIDIIRCDRGFLMDSPRYFLDAAKVNPPLSGYADWLWRPDNPIIYTCGDFPEYPAMRPYPYADVVKNLGHSYFESTPSYAIGLAIAMGVEEIRCYGMDYLNDASSDGKSGRACCEYWLGFAIAHRIKVYIAGSSTLCNQNTGRIPYGYPVAPST